MHARRPVAYRKGMAEHAAARREFGPEARAQETVNKREQIERDDAGGLDPRREQILASKPNDVLDAGSARRRFGLGDAVGIDIDAKCCDAAARSGNDDAPVAAAKVDKMIAGSDLGEIEHALDQRLGRRPERRIEMMRRARPRATE